MSEHNTSIDRSYLDNFSVKEFTKNELVPKFFPDEDVSDRTVGMVGLTTEQVSNISEDVFNTASVLFREAFPNRAEIDESIYSHAALFQLSNIFSSAASCTFILCIDEQAILDNRVKGALSYFYIDKNLEFNVDGIPFVLDYDIKIRVISKENENTGEKEYLYAASYVLDEDKNSISNIKDPYIKVRRTARVDNETLSCIALEVTAHQCYREIVYEPIINNSKINYPVIDVNYGDKIAGFDVYYRAPDSDEFIQMTPLLVYSQPLFTPFCYYELASTGVLRLSFNSKDSYWMPEFNSELKIVLYKTLGADGNFSIYNGSNYVINQDTERFKYSDKYVLSVKAVTASIGGSDQSNLEKLQALTLEAYRTANALTTENDLAEYFNNYKYRFNNSDILFLKRRDDLFERLYSSFIIMAKDDYKYKTSTLNIDTNLYMMNKFDDELYVIEPGTLFTSPETRKADFLLDDKKYKDIKLHYLTDCHYYSRQNATLDDLYKVVDDKFTPTDTRKIIKISEAKELMMKYIACDSEIVQEDIGSGGGPYYIFDESNNIYIQTTVYDDTETYYIRVYPDIKVGDYVIRHGYRDATESEILENKALLTVPDGYEISDLYKTNNTPQLSLEFLDNNPDLKPHFCVNNTIDKWKNQVIEEKTAITNKLILMKNNDNDEFIKYILTPVINRLDAIKINNNEMIDLTDVSYLYASTVDEIQALYKDSIGPKIGQCYVKQIVKHIPKSGATESDILYKKVDNISDVSIANTAKRYYIKDSYGDYVLVQSNVTDANETYYIRTNVYKVGEVINSSDAITTISKDLLSIDESVDVDYVEVDSVSTIGEYMNSEKNSTTTIIEGIPSTHKFIVVHDYCDVEKVEEQLNTDNVSYKVDTIGNVNAIISDYGLYNAESVMIGDIVIEHRGDRQVDPDYIYYRGYFTNSVGSNIVRKQNYYFLIEKEEYRTYARQINFSTVEQAENEFNNDTDISVKAMIGSYVVHGGAPVKCDHFYDILNIMNDGYVAIPKDDDGRDADVYIAVDSDKEFNKYDKYYTVTYGIYGNIYEPYEDKDGFKLNTTYYTHHAYAKSTRNDGMYSVFDYVFLNDSVCLSKEQYLYDITEEEFAELMHKYTDVYKFKKFTEDLAPPSKSESEYFCNGTDYTRYYIIQQDDQSNVEEYVRNRNCSMAEYASRYGYETPISSVFDKTSDELLLLDDPFNDKYLYVNPFLLRFSKNPNLLSTYLTYVHNSSVLDFVSQNDDSFVQFLSHQVKVDRGFNKDKNYHIKTRVSSNISLRNNHLPVNIEERETYDEETQRYIVVHYIYNEIHPVAGSTVDDDNTFIYTPTGYTSIPRGHMIEDGVTYYTRTSHPIINRFYDRDEDLKVIFAIFDDSNNMICYTELIPTEYDGSSYLFEGDIYTDDHISMGTSTTMRILEKNRYYKKMTVGGEDIIDIYEVNPKDIRVLDHYVMKADSNEMVYIDKCNLDDIDLTEYIYDRNTVNTSSYDTINVPLDNVVCKIFTLYNRRYDNNEQDLLLITEDDGVTNPFVKYEYKDSNIHRYIETNEYATATNPVTFIKYLDSVRTNLLFKDFISKNAYGDYINEPMDIAIKSIPMLRWSTCLDEELLDHFMSSFLLQYNTLISIRDERLRNATNIDVKLYNTYGHANNYYIGEDKERLNTVNLKLEFDMWFDRGTDITVALTEVKKFIKTEVETINENKTNNLHISNLMRKIEHNFDYVDHIRFVRINEYDTTYQTIKNIVVNLDELDKYERREYVPELLVIDTDNIIINEYLIDD